MESNEIYQELRGKGLNAAMLAEALGVAAQTVAGVIQKGCGSKRIASAVAAALDQPLEEVFPFYAEKQRKQAERQAKVQGLRRKLKA